jgi:hypothetical protein
MGIEVKRGHSYGEINKVQDDAGQHFVGDLKIDFELHMMGISRDVFNQI